MMSKKEIRPVLSKTGHDYNVKKINTAFILKYIFHVSRLFYFSLTIDKYGGGRLTAVLRKPPINTAAAIA